MRSKKYKRKYTKDTRGFKNGELVYVLYSGYESKAKYRLVKYERESLTVETTDVTRSVDGEFIKGWPGNSPLDKSKTYWNVEGIAKVLTGTLILENE